VSLRKEKKALRGKKKIFSIRCQEGDAISDGKRSYTGRSEGKQTGIFVETKICLDY
jgi:hypothetical protein